MLTGDAYRQSLNDGRRVFYDGEEVDVTQHGIFKGSLDVAAEAYENYYDPAPDAINTYFRGPSNVDELLHHANLKVDGLTSLTYSSIMTLLTSADRIEEIRPEGSKAIREYVKEMQLKDLRIAECITDAKGDRSKSPVAQEDPDAYLRVVERRPDGVVIRGAKLHISGAALAHELMVIPTKRMKQGEEDYSIACAVPVNAPGVKVVHVTPDSVGLEDSLDDPVPGDAHGGAGFVIFDDVFVPHERIFLDGEYAAAAMFAHSLGLWVRLNGLKTMADEADVFVGFAQLIAEANGLERAAAIRHKIADMVIHATLVRATLEAALANSTISAEGVVVPDELYANAGKYQAAEYRTAMIQHIQDIAGGSLVTSPSAKDLAHPEIGPEIRKYMSTKQSVDGDYRTKLFLALRDATASVHAGYKSVALLQSGGGLFAQRIVTRSRYNMDNARQKALQEAGLQDPFA